MLVWVELSETTMAM
ncbi:hypothetical protein HU200_008042 [Digitaria exilis]|uniref:Uncharacterized protein n=1 Tax=Digitaria exilis TaxID=1010633 RepID=A0A835FP54_9POAL|nr:hypothetical protein HU200_052883 [Digitaria exilis]KAF8765903.1 hypothetical protein HU200_008042 [Digitaria exilis]